MYIFYRTLTQFSGVILSLLLSKRIKNNKEIPGRVVEKKGISQRPRPTGKILWIHAASVGEAQSALILIKHISKIIPNIKILVTTGTVTSSELMEQRLPSNAFHQFFPLDHPKWVKKFINHWQPSAVIWIESELWPNMLNEIKVNCIPAILVNAHMSDKSFDSWKNIKSLAEHCLSTFTTILCQTGNDQKHFDYLGAKNTIVSNNIKHASEPLKYNQNDFNELINAVNNRPVWVFASTHDGEELLACNIHKLLKQEIPNILTIIVPRHPDRRKDIVRTVDDPDIVVEFRSNKKKLPTSHTDIYIADTMGELGLFYSLAPIACIGRTFSNDGGGGHNPIEAAQLNCAILHGPNVQNLQDIFDDMNKYNVALKILNSEQLYKTLIRLFNNKSELNDLQMAALKYSNKNNNIINNIMSEIISAFKGKNSLDIKDV